MTRVRIVNDEVTRVLFDVVDELNDQLPNERQLEKSADTVLFGRNGKLDSLGLVRLIIGAEERIEEEFDVTISLADAAAMSQERSPYRTIGALADYITLLLDELQ